MSSTKQKNEWISQKRDRINLLVAKGDKQKLMDHARQQGESLNAFVLRSIATQLKLDGAAAVPDEEGR